MTRDADADNAKTTSTHADSLLLAAIGRGDEDAMARLFQLHSKLVYSVAMRVLREQGAAEDVMQEVFLQIWRAPSSFAAAKGSLGGFLAVIARNRSIDVLRRRRPTDCVDDLPLVSPENLADDAERTLMIERVRTVMMDLPFEQSNALEMAFFGGCTHNEIAEQTGTPLGTVKTRVRSALQALGKALR